jgi:hypothetical protein
MRRRGVERTSRCAAASLKSSTRFLRAAIAATAPDEAASCDSNVVICKRSAKQSGAGKHIVMEESIEQAF